MQELVESQSGCTRLVWGKAALKLEQGLRPLLDTVCIVEYTGHIKTIRLQTMKEFSDI